MITVTTDATGRSYELTFRDPRTNEPVLTGDGYETVEELVAFILQMHIAITTSLGEWAPEEVQELGATTTPKLLTLVEQQIAEEKKRMFDALDTALDELANNVRESS